MDLSNLRAITNRYQDVRLVSLKAWKQAAAIEPRDYGGPYMVRQEGYDPHDLTCTLREFVLGKSGEWMPVELFLTLASGQRRAEFVFGTAAQIMALLESLPNEVIVVRPGQPAPAPAPGQDELNQAFLHAKAGPPEPPAP